MHMIYHNLDIDINFELMNLVQKHYCLNNSCDDSFDFSVDFCCYPSYCYYNYHQLVVIMEVLHLLLLVFVVGVLMTILIMLTIQLVLVEVVLDILLQLVLALVMVVVLQLLLALS